MYKDAKAIAQVLETNTTLKSLDLGGNLIDSEGAKIIAQALKTNTTLKSLDLGGNRIDSEGAKIIAQALKTNTSLESLNLTSSHIDSEGIKAVSQALKVNTTLTKLTLEWHPKASKTIYQALYSNIFTRLKLYFHRYFEVHTYSIDEKERKDFEHIYHRNIASWTSGFSQRYRLFYLTLTTAMRTQRRLHHSSKN